MSPDFVVSPAALARASTDRLRAYPADGRTARCSRATVSRLWLRTSGRAANSSASDASSPRASEISVSMRVPGRRARIASTHAATWAMPPSGRSSRATIVSTAWSRPMRSIASATRPGSSAAGASGLLVSTRQKPHARVQRSPSTMNVAVPSDQHSDRFGQPASSQTVTRPRSRIVFLSARTAGPWCTFGRSHSGLRASIASPDVTPAAASRDVRRTGSPGPAPREKSDRSSTRWRQATSWRSAPALLPHRSAASRATTSTTSRIGTSTPSSASEVTGRSPIPHATMCSRMYVRSVATLSAKPCIVRPRLSRTPMAQILRGSGPSGSTHTPGCSRSRPAVTPNVASASMISCSTLRTWAAAPKPLAIVTIG